jgi:hypothetical protein
MQATTNPNKAAKNARCEAKSNGRLRRKRWASLSNARQSLCRFLGLLLPSTRPSTSATSPSLSSSTTTHHWPVAQSTHAKPLSPSSVIAPTLTRWVRRGCITRQYIVVAAGSYNFVFIIIVDNNKLPGPSPPPPPPPVVAINRRHHHYYYYHHHHHH